MSSFDANRLSREDALHFAERLQLIVDYPRGIAVREESADQLQRLCNGRNWQFGAVEQAKLFVGQAVVTIPKWAGWSAMIDLFNSIFKPEPPPYDVMAPQPGECPKCRGAGTISPVPDTYARCDHPGCIVAKIITDAQLAFWNSPPAVDPKKTIRNIDTLLKHQPKKGEPIQ